MLIAHLADDGDVAVAVGFTRGKDDEVIWLGFGAASVLELG